jgi:hypothetical protein
MSENPKLKVAWFNEATNEFFTPKVRLVYPTLLEAKANKKYPTNPPKFSASALVPKTADIGAIIGAVQKLAQELYGVNWKEKEVKLPIKKTAAFDKLAEYAEAYPLMIRTSANADFPPFLLGPDAKPLLKREASEVYGGRWAVMALNVWGPKPENKDVNRFISLGVQRVQLLDHDDPIASGRVATAEGFDSFGGDSAFDSKPASADALFD